MARPQSPPILAQLRSAATVPEQAAALRALKNDIVGHVQKKQQWISLGVLEPVVRTILPEPLDKLNGKGPQGPLCSRLLSDKDQAKLQALQLLASFAHGGPAFLAPIHAGRALPGILSNISPFSNPPQIVTAALRALVDIADAAALQDPTAPLNTQSLADKVFAQGHLEAFNAILTITSSKLHLQKQVELVCDLIRKLCREERTQHALAMAGLLDTLATRLASFAVADGYVVPGAALAAQEDGLFEAFPDPAPASAKMGPVLEAIAAVVGESKYRAYRLACAPSILAVFPSIRFEPPRWLLEVRADLGYPGANESRGLDLSAMEYVLPAIPYPSPHPYSSSGGSSAPQSFQGTPDRSDSQLSSRNSHNKTFPRTMWDMETSRAGNQAPEADDIESPLVPWLIHLVRSRAGSERLMAASVLTSLYKAGLGSKHIREHSIGLLVVPLLVDIIVKNEAEPDETFGANNASKRQMILEHAPMVLARLIIDCEYLQKAAFDCKAVKALVKLLRKSYQPSEASSQGAMWSPYPDTDMDVQNTSPISQLGDHGHDAALAHRIRLREAALKAIGALAAGKEDYRKALVGEDYFVSYVFESLSEFPRKPRLSAKKRGDASSADEIATTVDPEFGRNPLSVIIAACHVVRTLSRSISILRTSLVDYGVAMPILHFLKHRDIDVQNAATATMANLVIEVSPVRELLAEKGVMSILCEHAHSDNPCLRLNALWALKHLVDAVGADTKKSCLEELEPGWLMQLIRDDAQQDAMYFNGGDKDNRSDDTDGDIDLDDPVDEQHRWVYGTNGELAELDSRNSSRMRQAEDRLAAVRETELNPARKARNDSIAIQEQGLNFIRNLIGHGKQSLSAEPSETTQMIDHLFTELGQDQIFEVLASKLRPKHLNPFSRRGGESKVLYPQAQIIVPTLYVLIHMAASDARHKQVVIAQTELFKTLAANSSKDRDVRVALCHLITNLACQEDDEEPETVRQRVFELKRLGFYSKLHAFNEDRDLDVKERAKNAVAQMDAALASLTGY